MRSNHDHEAGLVLGRAGYHRHPDARVIQRLGLIVRFLAITGACLVSAILGYMMGLQRGYARGFKIKDRYDQGYNVGISIGWFQAVGVMKKRYLEINHDPRYSSANHWVAGWAAAYSYLSTYWNQGDGNGPRQVAGDQEDP